MAHMVENMAYANELPWHGLGVSVADNLTPEQMMEVSGTNWTVSKHPCFTMIGDSKKDIGKSALIRDSDSKILDIISNDWQPTQNHVAFEFFKEFTDAGQMKMETAGSLDGGRNVWALAKIDSSFEAVRSDVVQSYLLFSNPHKYGQAITVRFTPIRVVCNNTLTMALGSRAGQEMSVSINHRQKFNAEEVKATLKIATMRLDAYKEAAKFLSTKRFTDEAAIEYMQAVFPKNTAYAEKKGNEIDTNELSKPAQKALAVVNTQPGAEFAEGTYWQLFNSVTYTVDHVLGHSADTRLRSAWFGTNRDRKITALKKAVEFAKAA